MEFKARILPNGETVAEFISGATLKKEWTAWDAAETYFPLQCVSWNGSSYVALKESTGIDPEADVTAGDGVTGESWLLIAEKGEKGDPATDHATLQNRDKPDQHPMGAITGLEAALSGKQPSGDYATKAELESGLAEKQPAGDYATNAALAEGLNGKQPKGDYATRTEVAEGLAEKQPAGDYATNDALTQGLTGKISTAEKGTAGGVASLGADGKVPAGQLPEMGGGAQIDDSTPAPDKVYSSKKVNDTYKKKIEAATFKYGDVMVCSRTAEEMITGMDQGIEYVLDSGMDVAKRIAYVDKAQNKVVFYSVEPLIGDGVTSSLDGKKVTVGPGNAVTVERMQSWEVTYADKLAWGAKPDIDDAATAADKVYSSQKTEAAIKAAVDALGTVFDYKGSKPSKTDLPADDNQAGDVWFVVDESVGYVWLKEGRWEPFGPTIDLSGYVPKTTKVNGKALDKDINLTAADIKARPETWEPDLSDYVNKSTTTPQTLNGNLSAKYLEGTWLKTTAATALPSAADKYAVIDPQGWIYYRTPEQVKEDLKAVIYVKLDTGTLMASMTSTEIFSVYNASKQKPSILMLIEGPGVFIAIPAKDITSNFCRFACVVEGRYGPELQQYEVREDGHTEINPIGLIKSPAGKGTAGQFLVSDGNGGSNWLTLTNRKDVGA